MATALMHNRVLNSGPKLPPKGLDFDEYTWEEISTVCKAGVAQEYWQLGDIKYMNKEDGAGFRIIGFDHDYVSDPKAYGREKAGITLQSIAAYSIMGGQMNTSNLAGTAWYSDVENFHCRYRKELLPAFLNTISEAFRNALVPVEKEYFPSDSLGRFSGVKATVSDTLFLLSMNELTGTYTTGAGSEGTQYAYFAAGNSYQMGWRMWTRSPLMSGAKFYYIDYSGTNIIKTGYVINSENYRGYPGLCI